MKRWLAFVVAMVSGLVVTPPSGGVVEAQTPPPISANAFHLVVDTSGSMSDPDPLGRVKLEGAKSALLQFLDGVQLGTAVGLRTYPDATAGDCNDGRLRFPVERHDPDTVSAVIRNLQPDGGTPTAEALLAAANDIRASGFPSATIVLVSDGESTCGDPCEAARDIVASGLNVQVITVGFRVSDVGEDELRCISSTTGGRYVDIDDSEELEQVLIDVSVPRLSIDVDHPAEVIAEVGVGRQGVVTITATVVNEGEAIADDVSVRLQFDELNPGVVAPVRLLGNLPPGSSSNPQQWAFRPGLLLTGKTITFSVVVRAANLTSDIGQDGEVSILDATTAEDAGPALDGKRLAILGDSYSAGEGADEYLAWTDTEANSCHRSRRTYAAMQLGIGDEAILACSGAVTNDVVAPNFGNAIAAQTTQLDRLQSESQPVDAVLISIGGNDVGFSTVIKTCLWGTCNEEINGQPTSVYVDEGMEVLVDSLVATYLAVHRVLNDTDSVRRRGGIAPIIVMGYPRPVPTVARSCRAFFGLPIVSTDEYTFIQDFITELNGRVEAATIAARQTEARVPAFYMPLAEESFLPDHTVCDNEPYARGGDSFDGAALEFNVQLKDFWFGLNSIVSPKARLAYFIERFGVPWFKRGAAEMFHPNQLGYEAMTRALLRWSNTSEANDIENFVRSVPPTDPGAVCDEVTSPVPLDIATPGQLLQSCIPYLLEVQDLAPGTTLRVVVNSRSVALGNFTVPESGVVQAVVILPADFESGQHTLRLGGYDQDLVFQEIAIPIEVAADSGPWWPASLAIGSLAAALIGLVLWLLGACRRRTQVAA